MGLYCIYRRFLLSVCFRLGAAVQRSVDERLNRSGSGREATPKSDAVVVVTCGQRPQEGASVSCHGAAMLRLLNGG